MKEATEDCWEERYICEFPSPNVRIKMKQISNLVRMPYMFLIIYLVKEKGKGK